MKPLYSRIAFLFLFFLGSAAPAALFAATYTVTTPTAANLMTAPNEGSLAYCVSSANANSGPDIITFTLDPASNSITVHSVMSINDPVEIIGNHIRMGAHDGTGSGATILFYLAIGSAGSTITGCSIVDCNYGIYVESSDNSIYDNRIGTDWADTPNLGNYNGIYVTGDYNTIGRLTAGNVIACNYGAGLYLEQADCNRVIGNYIGTDSAGMTALSPKQTQGLLVFNCAQTMIGGDRALGYGNLISGNDTTDVVISGAAGGGNTLCGNIIGLALDESVALSSNGVRLRIQQSSGNFIGLPAANYGNIICGDTAYEINLRDTSGIIPKYNVFQNNFIGTDSTGADKSTASNLFYVLNAENTLIGGNRTAGEGNVLSGAASAGLLLYGHSNTICGNYIGTNAAGTAAVPNGIGILVSGSNNLIGGPNGSGGNYGNIISGNTNAGIQVNSGYGNTLVGNFVGLNAAGTAALPNAGYGLSFLGGVNFLIGSAEDAYRNVISGNAFNGLRFSASSGHHILNNFVGLDVTGLSVIANTNDALSFSNGGNNIVVEDNFIAGTVYMNGVNVYANTLTANFIGVTTDLAAIPEITYGVWLDGGAAHNAIGSKPDNRGNLITSTTNGIIVNGSTTLSNGLFANTITAFSNQGIRITSSGNANHAIPVITQADTVNGVMGTAQANDYMEVFLSSGASGEYGGSLSLLGSTQADGSGNWSLSVGGLTGGSYVCATAADVDNNTSGFSLNAEVVVPPTLTYTPTGTITPTATPTPTVTLTATISPTITPSPTVSPSSTASPTATVTSTASATPRHGNINLRGNFVLPFPNPAKDEMRFALNLDEPADIRLEFYNVSGERIASLAASLPAGDGQILVWDCSSVAPGIYMMHILQDGSLKESRKIAILK